MLERDPKRRRLTPLNAPFRSPLRRPSSSSNDPSTSTSSSTSAVPPSYATPPRRTSSNFKSPLHNNSTLPPEIKELLARKRELRLEIKNEQKALETAELALKYEKQGGDENLEKLIKKWRICAQKTAERVFINARNRIDNMGGFQEFMKSQNQRKRPWDDEPEQQQSQDYEQEQYVEEEEEEETPGQEDGEEFTMEIMLRMAGVEEGIVKWDRELNNFRKE